MPQALWRAAADGRYRIDVVVGNYNLQAMLDSGLVDPLHLVGFELEPSIYDLLENSGWLTPQRTRTWRNASGQITTAKSGLTTAQLLDPVTGQPVGPHVQLFATRGKPGVPSRVGVVFFHRLQGCRVLLDLDRRTSCLEHP